MGRDRSEIKLQLLYHLYDIYNYNLDKDYESKIKSPSKYSLRKLLGYTSTKSLDKILDPLIKKKYIAFKLKPLKGKEEENNCNYFGPHLITSSIPAVFSLS